MSGSGIKKGFKKDVDKKRQKTTKNMVLKHWILPIDLFKTHLFVSSVRGPITCRIHFMAHR